MITFLISVVFFYSVTFVMKNLFPVLDGTVTHVLTNPLIFVQTA